MDERKVAYFSMEIAVDPEIPTYSGGLGMLAGDTIRAAADLGVPMVAVTLLYRKGYFYQTIDENGWQKEESVERLKIELFELYLEPVVKLLQHSVLDLPDPFP